MKSYGKVISYNGCTGVIRGMDGHDYLLLKKEIMDEGIRQDDYVVFDAEVYEDIEFTEYIARFVRKIENERDKD